jgi:hypothetical protein
MGGTGPSVCVTNRTVCSCRNAAPPSAGPPAQRMPARSSLQVTTDTGAGSGSAAQSTPALRLSAPTSSVTSPALNESAHKGSCDTRGYFMQSEAVGEFLVFLFRRRLVCLKHQFSEITEVKQHCAESGFGWVTTIHMILFGREVGQI